MKRLPFEPPRTLDLGRLEAFTGGSGSDNFEALDFYDTNPTPAAGEIASSFYDFIGDITNTFDSHNGY